MSKEITYVEGAILLNKQDSRIIDMIDDVLVQQKIEPLHLYSDKIKHIYIARYNMDDDNFGVTVSFSDTDKEINVVSKNYNDKFYKFISGVTKPIKDLDILCKLDQSENGIIEDDELGCIMSKMYIHITDTLNALYSDIIQ